MGKKEKLKKKRLRRLGERKAERRSARGQLNYIGILSATSAGYGFVRVTSGQVDSKGKEITEYSEIPDIFIPPKYINGAMNDDRVLVSLLPARSFEESDKGPAGRIKAILERGRTRLVGEYLAGNKIRPLNKRLPDDIDLAGGASGAQRGDWVEVELHENKHGKLSGAIVRSIGKAGVIANDLDAVCAEFGLASPYSAEEDKLAMSLPPREIKREDWTKKFTLTIDPADAKDFDDAISLAPGKDDNELEIGVHIADVAAYIIPDGKLDGEAARRGFSAYLPGRTLPMLPKSFTAKISLQAGVDSLCHSVILSVRKSDGEILRTRRCRTLINVDMRLNYDEVQSFLDRKQAPEAWTDEQKNAIQEMLDITKLMRTRRKEIEDFLTLDIPEIRVMVDENKNEITGIVKKIQAEADHLVEECMLAANSAVGLEMVNQKIPGLYRIHLAPEEEKIGEFRSEVVELFHLPVGDLTVRSNCNKFIDSLPDDPRRPAILSMLLRSMQRAEYSSENAIHFGLGKSHYVHFTSPIRRYPDLAVHQQLWDLDSGEKVRPNRIFEQLGLAMSIREKNNDDAFYAANDRLKLRYLAELMDNDPSQLYEAVIAKVSKQGLTVELPDIGLYGLVPAAYLPDAMVRGRSKLVGRKSHRKYQLGDFIYLKLDQIDFAKGQALFRPSI